MAVVTFDIDEFRRIYPIFEKVNDEQINFAFEVATTIVSNSNGSPVPYNPPECTNRKTILYLLTAHILILSMWAAGIDTGGAGGGGMGGAISNATEGSVSVGFAVVTPDGSNSNWYSQTQYGQMALRLLRPYMVGGRYYAVRHIHPWG